MHTFRHVVSYDTFPAKALVQVRKPPAKCRRVGPGPVLGTSHRDPTKCNVATGEKKPKDS